MENANFEFDIHKFMAFIDEVIEKVKIMKITFTGGEPSLESYSLLKAIEYVKGKCENITICTNGTLLDGNLPITTEKILNLVDNVSVSRHHWDNQTNNKILGLDLDEDIFENDFIHKVNLSCNLIRGYVDSFEGMRNILEFANTKGIGEVAFVKLMEINPYCVENTIRVKVPDHESVLNYRTFSYPIKGICECKNYAYCTDNGNIVKFYIRQNLCPEYNMGSYLIYKNNRVQSWYKEKAK
jgi:molybdenum cofactor biosynthesis enzyme MoaA